MEARVETGSSESGNLTSERIVNELKTMIQRAEAKAVEQAKAADKVIRDHPYQTVGLAFGLGLLIGILVRRN